MNIFDTHERIINDYRSYIESFLNIRDERIAERVEQVMEERKLFPHPLIQFNPSFEFGASLDQLCNGDFLHPLIADIFKGYQLYRHQVEALRLGTAGKDFIVTSGTGSGKSLTYIGTIFNHILRNPNASAGVKAIIVYPMNALINSQTEEFKKYQETYLRSKAPISFNLAELDDLDRDGRIELLQHVSGATFPITFAQYTGQEGQQVRANILSNPPDILMTNYMMLELIMTRLKERTLRQSIQDNLRFLVFDELHTYRGRQGSDVSMLIRRIRAGVSFQAGQVQCIGTSATMSSGGDDLEAQKAEVATVGQMIFGKPFTTEQIVVESLERLIATSGEVPTAEDLKRSFGEAIRKDWPEERLKTHPLAVWLENRIGLEQVGDWLRRRKPVSLQTVAEKLHEDTGGQLEMSHLEETLKKFLDWAAQVNTSLPDGSRRRYFPFRLHQFISQTGSVYLTLDAPDKREIRLEPGHYIRTEEHEKQQIYQTVFSRVTGYEFICVRLNANSCFAPRDFNDRFNSEEDNGEVAGYLIPQIEGEEELWSVDMIEMLPASWYKDYKRSGIDVVKKYRHRIPQEVWYDDLGNYSFDGPRDMERHQRGWFMPAPLLFDPTSLTFYDPKTNDASKLMRLGNEGRSTATTTLSLATIKSLATAGIRPEEQKLLSFTDNRQDASLQSGHFNDFVNIGRIRSAIWHALKNAPDGILRAEEIADKVFDNLNIQQEEYAQKPATFAGRIRANENALKDYLTVRIFQDLKRSWRYTMPNLEQCALLTIDYDYISEEIDNPEAWGDNALMMALTTEQRLDFLVQTLDYIRTSYGVFHRFFVEENRQVVERVKNALKDDWSFDKETQTLEFPSHARVTSIGRTIGRNVHSKSVGKVSGWGKYVSALADTHNLPFENTEAFEVWAQHFFSRLDEIGVLRSEELRGEKGQTTGYLINPDAILWTIGDEVHPRQDKIRRRTLRDDVTPKPNSYFQNFYQQDFGAMKPLRGREHTGQVSHEDRIQREGQFRSGELCTLFCSPTMELGIDIANLNVVHMRNVPPNPANYAQRSGRAGRSGQGALVITYCSQLSPHDRNYFQNMTDMVAGKVVAPRINLDNAELIQSHVQAVYLQRVGVDMNNSVDEILDMSDPKYPIRPELWEKITGGHARRREEVGRLFTRILEGDTSLGEVLTTDRIQQIIDDVPAAFQLAFDRWRTLYHNAERLRDEARKVIDSPIYDKSSTEYRQADRNERFARNQLAELLNTGKGQHFSEFYPFRYLASEGFLPGYNFTRLPLRTAIGGYESAQFLSRGRLLGLREFGPRANIYHNGQTYQVDRINATDIEPSLQKAKISRTTGYFMIGEEYERETDPINGHSLSGERGDILHQLLEMTETSTRMMYRISCEEEERTRTGFDISTYFNLPEPISTYDRIKVKSTGEELLDIIYMPTAKIVQVNKGWRRSQEEQFIIDKHNGYWKKLSDREKDEDGSIINVSLYTDVTTNALYIQPMEAMKLDAAGIITLQHALKRAIEEHYQVEDREIGVTLMGEDVANIMVYEASEGSIGVLSQLAKDKREFPQVVAKAYELCHFANGDDIRSDLGPASYNDLLGYYNQRDHEQIDRYLIKDTLERLLHCEIELKGNRQVGGYEEHYQYLLNTYDQNSRTERDFLDHLYQEGLRLPDSAQPQLNGDYGLYVMPDFQYDDHTFVFCDGTPHDDPELARTDRKKRNALRRRGLRVITYHYRNDLRQLVEENRDVFIKVR